MTEHLSALIWTVVGAGVLAVLAVTFSPVRRRLLRAGARIEGGHVIVRHVELDPTRMSVDPLDAAVYFHFKQGQYPGIPAPSESLAARWRWAHDHGGVDVGTTAVTVTLENDGDGTVIVDPPRFDRHRDAVEAGELSWVDGLGGGGVVMQRYDVDLDAGDPLVGTFVPPSSDPEASPSRYLVKGDVLRVQVVASAEYGSHRWRIELPLIIAGKEKVLTIDDRGSPFMTVGRVDAQRISTAHRDR